VVLKGDHIITSGTSPTGTILSFAVIMGSFQVPVMSVHSCGTNTVGTEWLERLTNLPIWSPFTLVEKTGKCLWIAVLIAAMFLSWQKGKKKFESAHKQEGRASLFS
jgi:hypothetical protein